MVLFALLICLGADPALAPPPTAAIPPEFVEYFEREQAETVKRREEIAAKIEGLDATWEKLKDPQAKIENRKKRAELSKLLSRLDYKNAHFRPDLTKKGSVGWIPEAEIVKYLDDSTAVMMGQETKNVMYVLQGTSPRDLRIGRKPDFKHPWQVVEIEQPLGGSPNWEKALNIRELIAHSGRFCVVKPIPIRDLEQYRRLANQPAPAE